MLLALKSPLLGSRISSLAIGVATLAVLGVVWWIYAVSPPTWEAPLAPKKVAQKADLDVAYMDFYAAMSSPSPGEQLDELAHTLEGFYALPGWAAANIRSDGNQYRVQLERQGGSYNG